MAADTSCIRSQSKKTLGAADYIEKAEFSHGMLPSGIVVI